MDMYYYLKDELTCKDCKYPLSYSKNIGNMTYIAVCIGCGKKYEINIKIKNT